MSVKLLQWNLPERPPLVSNHLISDHLISDHLVSDHLTKFLTSSSVSQIAIKRPPPISDHLSLTPSVVTYSRFHCTITTVKTVFVTVLLLCRTSHNLCEHWSGRQVVWLDSSGGSLWKHHNHRIEVEPHTRKPGVWYLD